MNVKWLPLAMALLLTGCAQQTAAPTSAPAGVATAKPADPAIASDTNPYCHMAPFSRNRSRAGDDIPMRMYVVNRNAWCFSGFGWNEGGTAPAEVYDKPSHGELRTIVRGNGVVFGYRPKPGFVGDDDFVILLPTGVLGIDSHLKVAVAVTAP